LKAYITAKESTEVQASDSNRHVESHSSAEALMMSTKQSKDRNVRNVKSPVCSFCDGCHWTNKRRKYKSIEEQKQRIKGKCVLCLRPEHRIKELQSCETMLSL
jgi:hypothetical protein